MQGKNRETKDPNDAGSAADGEDFPDQKGRGAGSDDDGDDDGRDSKPLLSSNTSKTEPAASETTWQFDVRTTNCAASH